MNENVNKTGPALANGGAVCESTCESTPESERDGGAPDQPIGGLVLETVCKCGASAHQSDRFRCARGHALKANPLAVVTQAHSIEFWREAAAEQVRLRDAFLADRGYAPGVQKSPTPPAALVVAADGLAQAALLRDGLWRRLIEAGGPLSSADRARRVLKVWQETADRALKHVQVIGTDRVASPIPSASELLRGMSR